MKRSPKRQEIAVAVTAAVRAYRLARRRALMQNSVGGREAVKVLAVEFPEFYSSHGPGRSLVFTGESADDIIENYLQEEKRGGREWRRLATLVVYRGERAETTP
jgi:hypothetical protein